MLHLPCRIVSGKGAKLEYSAADAALKSLCELSTSRSARLTFIVSQFVPSCLAAITQAVKNEDGEYRVALDP